MTKRLSVYCGLSRRTAIAEHQKLARKKIIADVLTEKVEEGMLDEKKEACEFADRILRKKNLIDLYGLELDGTITCR